MKMFKYWQPSGFYFRCRHQVDYHNSKSQSNISLERTWATKSWVDSNFSWYLAVTEVNTALASGHFQNGGNIMLTLDFWRQLVLQCMENTIGTDPGSVGRPIRACRRAQIVEYKPDNIPNYRGKWLASEKNPSRNIRSSAARTILNASIGPGLIAYATEEFFYNLGNSSIIR